MVALLVIQTSLGVLRQGFYGPGPLKVPADVVIPAGGTARVALVLAQAGAVTSALAFRVAAWGTRKDGTIHAGEFLIPARSSIAQILQILRFGAPVQHQVTIPPGLTARQIAGILAAAPGLKGAVAVPAEGAVLPQTYNYTWGMQRSAVLARAEAAMGAELDAAWGGRDAVVPLANPREALILASIVQEESPAPAELPEIAAVYENRLVLGMKLQADPTVIYAASGGAVADGRGISRADLGNASAYNTYVHGGLPPGPICAPGAAAIAAVLHPAASGALYFVDTGKGAVFADDFRGQLRNIREEKGK